MSSMDLIFFLHHFINMLIAQTQSQSFEQTARESSVASYFVSHIVAKRIRLCVHNSHQYFTCLFLWCCYLHIYVLPFFILIVFYYYFVCVIKIMFNMWLCSVPSKLKKNTKLIGFSQKWKKKQILFEIL